MTRAAEQEVRASAESDFRGMARGGIGNLAGAVVSALVNFALAVLIARSVSAEQAGQFFAATSVFLLLEVVGRLGADTGLVYFIARWRALGRPERIPGALRAAIAPCAAFGAVMGVGVFALAPTIAHWLGDPQGHSAALLRLLAIALPVTITYDLCMAATRGYRSMRPTVLVEKMLRPCGQLLLVLAAVAVGWRGGIGVGWTVPYFFAAAAGAYLLRALMAKKDRAGRHRADDEPVRSTSGEFWRFALPRAAAAIAQLASQRLDIILVAVMRGATEAAIYTAATRFLVVGQFVNQAINTVVQPRISAAMAVGAKDRARALYQVSTTWLVLVSWPLFGTAAALAPLYLKVFGGKYHTGTTVVVLLSVAMLFASGVGVVDTVIIMAGRTSWNLMTTVAALGLNIAVDLVLIPSYGILGAAIGWMTGILAANLVPLVLVWKRLDLHPFGRGTCLAYGLCAVCYLVVPLLAWTLSGKNELVVAIALVISTAAFCAGVVRWREPFQLTGLVGTRRRTSVHN